MQYDRKEVDRAILEKAGKVFLVHTVETVAATYRVLGSEHDTLKSIQERFELCDPSLHSDLFDQESLTCSVDEVQVG